MEKRSMAIGEILSGLGRITPADVDRALAHQRERGGFFGDALVELGLLSADEVKFALADQYDIPFVHLQPEGIDPAVAQMVPAEWAREHQMLPVLRDGDTVTVVLTVPPTAAELEAVQRFTRAARLEAAVSTSDTINRLIAAVHGERDGAEVPLAAWIARAFSVDAREVGFSIRGDRVAGWYRADGILRSRISGAWPADLRRMISPYRESDGQGVHSWPAILTVEGRMWRVDCTAVGSGMAAEWVLRRGAQIPAEAGSALVEPELRSAVVRGLASGSVVLRACRAAEDVGEGVVEAMLPTLPASLLEPGARSLHVVDRAVAVPPGVLSIPSEDRLRDVLASLESFALDALTLDVERLDAASIAAARRVAPLVAYRDLPGLEEALEADHRTCLANPGTLTWTLTA